MSFKVHLIIISAIIAVLCLVQFLIASPPPAAPQVIKLSEYSISIVRASWGLNCRLPKTAEDDPYQSTDGSMSKIRENNVLTPVSNVCNGKDKCDILVDPSMLGEDPLPNCMSKTLQVEYRCFSVDRLRAIKGQAGVLNIDCESQLKQP